MLSDRTTSCTVRVGTVGCTSWEDRSSDSPAAEQMTGGEHAVVLAMLMRTRVLGCIRQIMHVDDARKHAHREYQAGDDDRATRETTARLEVLAHEPTDTPLQ